MRDTWQRNRRKKERRGWAAMRGDRGEAKLGKNGQPDDVFAAVGAATRRLGPQDNNLPNHSIRMLVGMASFCIVASAQHRSVNHSA